MIWFFVTYFLVGYYHFHQVLAGLQEYDSVDTVILNGALALTIGPLFLIPAMLYGYLERLDRFIWEHFKE